MSRYSRLLSATTALTFLTATAFAQPALKKAVSIPAAASLPFLRGNLESVTSQTLVNGSWVDAAQTRYFYEGDQIAAQHELVFDQAGQDWIQSGRTAFSYAGSADTTTTIDVVFGIDSPDERIITTYQYDWVSGRRIPHTILVQDWQNGTWTNVTLDSLFTENFEITAGVHYEWMETWRLSSRMRIEQHGPHVVQTEEVYAGNAWISSEKVIVLNETRAAIYERFRAFEEASLAFGLAVFMAGMPEMEHYKWTGSDWEMTSRQTKHRTYDFPGGRLQAVSTVSASKEDGEWITDGVFTVRYDENDRVVRASLDTSLENPVSLFEERYAYGASGNVSAIEIYVFGFEGLTLVSRYQFAWKAATAIETPGGKAASFELLPAYPNPFNPSTVIPFALQEAANVHLAVFDASGRMAAVLVNGRLQAGQHSVAFNAAHLSSGVYLVKLQSGGMVRTRKISLVK